MTDPVTDPRKTPIMTEQKPENNGADVNAALQAPGVFTASAVTIETQHNNKLSIE